MNTNNGDHTTFAEFQQQILNKLIKDIIKNTRIIPVEPDIFSRWTSLDNKLLKLRNDNFPHDGIGLIQIEYALTELEYLTAHFTVNTELENKYDGLVRNEANGCLYIDHKPNNKFGVAINSYNNGITTRELLFSPNMLNGCIEYHNLNLSLFSKENIFYTNPPNMYRFFDLFDNRDRISMRYFMIDNTNRLNNFYLYLIAKYQNVKYTNKLTANSDEYNDAFINYMNDMEQIREIASSVGKYNDEVDNNVDSNKTAVYVANSLAKLDKIIDLCVDSMAIEGRVVYYNDKLTRVVAKTADQRRNKLYREQYKTYCELLTSIYVLNTKIVNS